MRARARCWSRYGERRGGSCACGRAGPSSRAGGLGERDCLGVELGGESPTKLQSGLGALHEGVEDAALRILIGIGCGFGGGEGGVEGRASAGRIAS